MHFQGTICLVILKMILRNNLAESSKTPKIDTRSFDSIRNPGDNLSVFCEGYAPLEWRTPKVRNQDYKKYTTLKIVEAEPRHQGYLNAIELQIKNMSYFYVGFYICQERDNKSALSSAIYIYVQDKKHLAVWVENSELLIYTVLNASTRIPCRPTAPDVEVTLVNVINGNNLEIPLNTLIGGRYYAYNPFGGIMTNDTIQVKDVSLRCYFRRGDFSLYIPIRMVVEIRTYFLEEPSLSSTRAKDIAGNYNIVLRCQVRSYVHVIFEWISVTRPWTKSKSRIDRRFPDIIYSNFILSEGTAFSHGVFICIVRDYQHHESSTGIILKERGILSSPNITISSASILTSERSIQVAVSVESTAVPDILWFDKEGSSILFGNSDENDLFFYGNRTRQKIFLTIKNTTSKNEGNYTLVALTKYSLTRKDIFVGVPRNPKVKLKMEKYQILNKPTTVSCMVSGFPEPFVKFSFKPCLDHNCEYTILNYTRHYINDTIFVVTAEILPTRSGKIKCLASFEYSAQAESELYVTDIEDGFGIQLLDISYHNAYDIIIITTENSVSLSCGAYILNSTQSVGWRKDNKDLQISNSKYILKIDNTKFSNKIILTIRDISINEEGIYTCVLYENKNKERRLFKSKQITLYVSRHVPPNIIFSNMNETSEVNDEGQLDMICKFGGRPEPNITWYKNDQVLTFSAERFQMNESKNQISILHTSIQDEGNYTCEAINAFGKISRKTRLRLKERPGFEWYFFLIGILILLVLFSSVTTYIFHIRKRKLEDLLLEAGLHSFEEGRLEHFDPALGINDQADLLPYDKSYEFPIQNLVLGERLGAGAFGVVLKGEARKIVPEEEVTIVAVKMVQDHEQNHIKALVSELKILIHLGKHLNVVNLLGACTKKIAQREILMIVEYCRFGNVHDYLLRQRNNFIDQINPKTGEIDFLVENINLKQNSFVDAESSSNTNGWNGSTHSLNEAGRTCEEDVKMHSFLQDNNSENHEQTERPNDNWKNERPSLGNLKTKDLLSWAFQVARGMNFLVSRKILHGDLAARNILLADHGIVKISDFGLSKCMLQTDSYKSMSDDPLPIKWMAIEAIRSGIFSTQSDIWSFGVLLWEFFSLSETPYPGMKANQDFFTRLTEGYRMDSPAYSTEPIYRMMLECWSANPLSRPAFSKLEQRLGFMLDNSVKQHYIDLNHPYKLMNNQRLNNEAVDYLNMASPPNYENFSSAVERPTSQDCIGPSEGMR